MHQLKILISIVFLNFFPIAALASPPEYQGKVLLFGNLHAHSKFSDDVRERDGEDLSPAAAFRYAHENGLDFLAITDHHKAVDSNHRLFMSASEYENELVAVAKLYNESNNGRFIAIPGIEWGNTATGNHVNVFGSEKLPPDLIKDRDYDKLYQWASVNADFIQFNHPYGWGRSSNRDRSVGNFGSALYDSQDAFIESTENIVKTITIIASVKGGHLSGEHKHSEQKVHRDLYYDAFKEYKRFLNNGHKLAPAANQDTHWKNWGTVTAARTAVWADDFTYQGLISGIKSRRVYATEDDELVVAATVKIGSQSYWMGEVIPIEREEVDAELVVNIKQAGGSDGDPTDEGPYDVTIFKDEDGVGGNWISELLTVEQLKANRNHKIPVTVKAGQYFFVQVTETNGQDNVIGEGDDEYNNELGEPEPDGKRDDLNDSAWTAPFWFEHVPGEQKFIWSVHSDLYHNNLCWAVERIGMANRRSSNTPPEGKIKHTCLDN